MWEMRWLMKSQEEPGRIVKYFSSRPFVFNHRSLGKMSSNRDASIHDGSISMIGKAVSSALRFLCNLISVENRGEVDCWI